MLGRDGCTHVATSLVLWKPGDRLGALQKELQSARLPGFSMCDEG
ncbi:hypothetical protein CVCC1112_2466 [Paenarthrobacter nicotinovorans]|nr:hypothetical protein ANMWB30_36560 [Arthrobacter sp. MWB30]GAT87807.1 hypothetical protein CVCC1112_2466 [Paenarthrobacter nicotinovorans]